MSRKRSTLDNGVSWFLNYSDLTLARDLYRITHGWMN